MIKLRVKGVVVCKPNIVEPSKICTYIKSIQRKLGKKKTGEAQPQLDVFDHLMKMLVSGMGYI